MAGGVLEHNRVYCLQSLYWLVAALRGRLLLFLAGGRQVPRVA
jgi:hypothetical protein